MNDRQQKQIFDNSTKLYSFIVSSSPLLPVRTRTVINVIYISGIVFMIIVFLVLLWINLYSQRCWCWHDTRLIQRFNREWIIRRSQTRNTGTPVSKHQRQRRLSNDNELLS
ncbi:unnamed protein product [Rotaria magnacalcarata]|uniref:Uncharacterized protein n=1 Tax=Rotaria magnacalcarata TaxID=392030 RepID=A0A816SIB6_9BILA|nr:unnamed protein product [Rotaria magnacalcarata]CAF1354923.1 unnamed protein product [Rotaria magnacalcarata]CAF1998396.1 unnamed protein product [Rotaria magnacalcarata]CAF2060700.1 unnamed protein product [Rotaria magnacalcarata]CAF2085412.1 unnamed protein product [Rotaria magnacalcarata]